MRHTLIRNRPVFVLLLPLLLGLVSQSASAQVEAPQNQLWDAAMQGDTVAMAAALKQGARIDSLDTRRNPNGRRALNWAAWYNRPVAIRFLVAHGATINAANVTGFTPLHHAAENGSVEAAQVLLELGADWTLLNGTGLRPADVARERGQLTIIVLLDSLPKKK